MKKFMFALAAIALILSALIGVQAQTAGSISGSVMDPNGAMVPGATVKVKGDAGQEFTATTADNGTFKIPAVQNGLYVVTITANGFKTTTITNVKVNVNAPTPVDAKLELGNVGETVEISSGGEVLQTETPTIGTTITGRQILETPIASRDALDLVGLLPGTATVGRPRQASINGLPKGSLNITLDGVDVQDNLLRSSDGYFTFVRPRVDAIEEVTVSTAVPGAEASGDGAVQLSFRTKRGGNGYHGGVFFQHRDESLNANYWYLNRDGARDTEGHAFRQKLRLNQFGGHFSGPIPYFAFGDGGGPQFKSGRDTAFFFVNYEQYRLPNSQSRTRNILSPSAQAGTYSYIVNGATQSVNLFGIAGLPLTTADPTVAGLLTQIRTAVGTTGSVTPVSGSPNLQLFNFSPTGNDLRKFLTTRFDVNITKKHSVEFIMNRDDFVPSKDFLNSQDERFPGMPFYTQGSKRDAYSLGVRSTLSKSLINYGRYTISTGQSFFSQGISKSDYAYQGGYDLLISGASFGGVAVTTATARNSYSDRNSPTYAFDDSLTWLMGSHSIQFGGQYKRIKLIQNAIGRIVPSISFGLDSTDPAFGKFTGGATGTIPNASSAQLTEARALYAVLIGRITQYATTAYLTADGTYKENALQSQNARQDTYGLFAQDSWKIRPNLTINFGVRWQPQGAYTVLTENYARLSSFNDIFGKSGPGNLFKPGTLTGVVPTVVGMKTGEKAYPDDKNNFGPSVGVVWSPEFKSGFLKSVLGGTGNSVLRGGYSRSFVREGTALIGSILGANPGGTQSATRNFTNGNLTVSNLRDPSNPNLTPGSFPASPAYPFALTSANSANAFDPNLKTGYVDSFSFGYQRQIDKDTVVEIRYVGNRGHDLFRQHNINEFNTIENGFADEFKLAQTNLYANMLAGKGATFAYTGAGTSQLPKMLAYFCTPTGTPIVPCDPSNQALYTAASFTNSTLVAALSRNNPNLIGAFSGSNFEANGTRRLNATKNGLAENFFYANSTTLSTGAFVLDNSALSWYDSGVVELRRRLSAGLRLQASYVWSKARSDSFQSNSDNFANFSHRSNGRELAKNVAVFDIRHQFKFDATYDLPFGRGRKFMSGANGFADALLGGWTLAPTLRWQSGTPFSFGNVALVGMTTKELQKSIGVYKNTIVTTGSTSQQVVTYLPLDIIENTRRAFDVNVATTNDPILHGYNSTFGGAPTGRFIAPAGYGNCISTYSGECGFNNLIVYGPGYFKLDSSLSKQFKITETSNIQIRATFLDVLNMPNFRVGGWTADTVAITPGGSTFGQMGNGSAYQDVSTTNDPGGRLIDLMIRFNF